MKDKTKSVKISSLREVAKERLRKRSDIGPSLTEEEAQKLLHELEVHQIELEMQNEQLQVANDEIRAISENFSLLYDFAPTGYFTITRDGTIHELNLFAARLLGRERSNLVGKNLKLFFNHDTLQIFNDFLQKIFEERIRETCEVQLNNNEKSSSFLRLDGTNASDESKCLISAIDITDKIKAVDVIKNSARQWATTFDSMKEAVSVIDLEGHILQCNKAMKDMLKKSTDQIIKHHCWELIHGTQSPIEDCPIERMRSSLKRENRLLQLGEKYFDIIADPIFDEKNNLIGAVHIINDITERKEIDKGIRKEKKFIENIINTAQVIILISDEEGRIVTFNPYMEKISGYRLEEVKGKDWLETFIPKEDRATFRELFSKTVSNAKLKDNINTLITKQGCKLEIEWHHAHINSLDDDKNLLSIGLNVTERKKLEKELKEREKRYKMLFECSSDAIMTLNPPKWLFTSCNLATIKMFRGRDEAEFISKTPYELSPEYQPDGRASAGKALEMINTAISKGSHFFEWTYRRTDGEEFLATVLLKKIVLENEEFLQATVRDISESKEMREKINASEKRFMDVLHASKDAILLIDKNTFIECNQATAEMLGYKNKGEFLMTHPSKLSPKFQPDGKSSVEKADEMMKLAIERGYHRFEWIHTKANGEDFPVEVSLTPISHQGKTVLHCLWRDISGVKKAEKELSKKIHDLEVFNKAAVERELKMIELKKRIRELEKRIRELEGG